MPTRTETSRTDLALLVLRLVLGTVFLAHGGQKLFVFGLGGVQGAFGQMGIPGAGVVGPLTAFVEFFGGLAVLTGLLTRLAGVGLAITMLGAIALVHLPAGFFAPKGVEFPLSLLGIAASLAIAGAGRYSLDHVLATRRGTTTPDALRGASPATASQARTRGDTRVA
jgi:putative oxidoreductase